MVWVVRRSLRLLTLLTLMASALCSGQSLAGQDIAAQDLGHAIEAPAQSTSGMTSAIAASVISDVPADFPSASPATAPTLPAPVALQRPARDFSPRIERAPPLA